MSMMWGDDLVRLKRTLTFRGSNREISALFPNLPPHSNFSIRNTTTMTNPPQLLTRVGLGVGNMTP